VGGGEGLLDWRVAANILHRQYLTAANKRQCFGLVIGCVANNCTINRNAILQNVA
jgi:hypothetical protein